MQENSTNSLRKLKLSNRHKIILGHLNVNSLQNKFLSQLQMLFREHLTFSFYQKLKLTKVSLVNSFAQITLEYFEKIETGMGEKSCFM